MDEKRLTGKRVRFCVLREQMGAICQKKPHCEGGDAFAVWFFVHKFSLNVRKNGSICRKYAFCGRNRL